MGTAEKGNLVKAVFEPHTAMSEWALGLESFLTER